MNGICFYEFLFYLLIVPFIPAPAPSKGNKGKKKNKKKDESDDEFPPSKDQGSDAEDG